MGSNGELDAAPLPYFAAAAFASAETFSQVSSLEKNVPDPTTQAAFNRLGFCFRPGMLDDEEYKFGERRRLTRKEIQRDAKKVKRCFFLEELV